jgi:hypothetical protein
MGSSRIREKRTGIFRSGPAQRAGRENEKVAARKRQQLCWARRKKIVAQQAVHVGLEVKELEEPSTEQVN